MVMEDIPRFQNLPQPVPVRRMTFAYDSNKISLVSEQQVTMIVQPSHPLEKIESTPGFSVILRDEAGTPIYRRVLENPIRYDVEVYSTDPKQSLSRVPSERPKGTFVIIIPDAIGARTLELYAPPLGAQTHSEPPRLLGRFTLAAIKKFGTGRPNGNV
jgi:hypothetical protein